MRISVVSPTTDEVDKVDFAYIEKVSTRRLIMYIFPFLSTVGWAGEVGNVNSGLIGNIVFAATAVVVTKAQTMRGHKKRRGTFSIVSVVSPAIQAWSRIFIRAYWEVGRGVDPILESNRVREVKAIPFGRERIYGRYESFRQLPVTKRLKSFRANVLSQFPNFFNQNQWLKNNELYSCVSDFNVSYWKNAVYRNSGTAAERRIGQTTRHRETNSSQGILD